jgi:hypothetical protein
LYPLLPRRVEDVELLASAYGPLLRVAEAFEGADALLADLKSFLFDQTNECIEVSRILHGALRDELAKLRSLLRQAAGKRFASVHVVYLIESYLKWLLDYWQRDRMMLSTAGVVAGDEKSVLVTSGDNNGLTWRMLALLPPQEMQEFEGRPFAVHLVALCVLQTLNECIRITDEHVTVSAEMPWRLLDRLKRVRTSSEERRHTFRELGIKSEQYLDEGSLGAYCESMLLRNFGSAVQQQYRGFIRQNLPTAA